MYVGKSDQKWVFDLFEDFSFGDCVFELVFIDDELLSKGFHGESFLGVAFFYKHDLPICPSSQHLYNIKIVHRHLILLQVLILLSDNPLNILRQEQYLRDLPGFLTLLPALYLYE